LPKRQIASSGMNIGKDNEAVASGTFCQGYLPLLRALHYCLVQWPLTFFTYLTLVSNNIIIFTPNTLNGAHFLKI